LLDPGRLGAASAPHEGCNLLGAAAFIRVQGEMQKRGLARWVDEQQRLEEKRQKPLESIEDASKVHRNTIEIPS
jgi:hypothetical protein